MVFSYTLIIYEKGATTTVYPDMLAETFKLDESLDSAVIAIPRLTRKLPFKRFSRIRISKNDNQGNIITADWLIYSTKAEISTKSAVEANRRYNHTLAMIEPAKWLEKFIIGTKTFTQPLDGTQITLDEAIEQIIKLAPFVPLELQPETRLVELDSTFASEIEDDRLPQLFFEKKNAREIFIEIFKAVKAIPRMFYDTETTPHWKLKGDFINQKLLKFVIDFEAIDYISEASGDNFAQKAEMFHENTVPENYDKNTANVFANSVTEYITFRSDEIIVGESNFKLKLAHKLQNFISLEIFVPNYGALTNQDVDITDYCYNKLIYDTLEYDDGVGSRSHAVYWQYGNNSLDGFNETFNQFGTGIALDNILDDIGYRNVDRPNNNGYTFKVTYVPLIENMRSQQYRVDRNKYDLTADMFDNLSAIQLNPKERINDLYDLTGNVYGQMQRIGVDTVSFSRKHYNIGAYDPDTNTGGIYSLGDYTEDNFLVTKVEILYYRAFAIARYEVSRDWNRIAQFIRLDKEYRPYEISLTKTDYNVKRDINIPLKFVVISNEDLEDTLDTQTTLLKYNFLNTFRDSLVTLTGIPYSAAALQINYENGDDLQEEATYKPLMVMAEKNTIKFKLDFADTKLAGKKVEIETKVSTTLLKQILVPYTLEDGTFQYGRLHLFDSYWEKLGEFSPIYSPAELLAAQSNKFPEITLHADDDIRLVTTAIGNQLLEFSEAYVYATYADFPPISEAVNYRRYLDLAQRDMYEFSPIIDDYDLIGAAWFIERNPDFSTSVYEINKDKSEILGVEMPIPILPAEDLDETFIIGDMISRKNVLVTGINETLYYQPSATRYQKSNTERVAVDFLERIPFQLPLGSSELDVPSIIYNENNYCVVDGFGNLFLAVNQVNLDDTKTVISTIYFNFLDESYLYSTPDNYEILNIGFRDADIIYADILYHDDIIIDDIDFVDNDVIEAEFIFVDFQEELVSVAFRDNDRMATTFNFIEHEIEVISVAFKDSDRITLTTEEVLDTITPTIAFTNYTYSAPNHQFTFLITNNSDLTAEIFADTNTTPTTSQGLVISTSSKTVVLSNTTGDSMTLYTRAKTTDENYSVIVSKIGSVS
jgi:hypothetical protein